MLRLAKLSLMARASLALAAVGLAPLGVVPFLVGMNRDAMEDQVLRLHAVAARSAAERVYATLQPWQSAAAALARNPLVAADPRSAGAREALLSQVEAHAGVAGVAVVNPAGDEFIRVQVAAHAEAAARLLRERSASPFHARVRDRGYLVIEAPLEGREGTVRLLAELSGLREITRPEELGADALLAVASAKSGLIAAADPRTRMDSFPGALLGAATSGRVSGAGRYLAAPGRAVLGAYAPVAGTDWFVVSTQPASVAEAVANRMKQRSALAVTLAVALVALGSHVAWRTIVRPLRALAVAQRRLAKERARGSKGDEIADLHATFSALERQLRDRDTVGQVFLGRYQVLEPIGSGGMGTVFKGWDPKLKRHVALKTVHLGQSLANETRGGQVRNLLNEALTVARFSHRNIVAIYDLEDLGSAAFVAMELVDGTTLERHLRRHSPLPPAQVVPLGVAIARGLAAAHAQRVVHRDIKPGNVLLGKDGSIKIADFGIASALSMLAEEADMVFGTPGYIPPEGIRGAGQTEKGDLFALGVMLYECLAGVMPFEGKDASEIMRNTLDAEIPRLRERPAAGPRELLDIVAGLLEREPEARRPASAEALADALGRMAVLNDWRWGEVATPQEELEELPAHTYSLMLSRTGLATRSIAGRHP